MDHYRLTLPQPLRLNAAILCIVMIFAIRSFAFAESQSETGHIKWRELSVLPAGISESAREILKKGLINGHNPHSFSKIGDCYASTSWFIADFDLGKQYYNLGPFEADFAPVIEYYQGSFGTHSLAARPGFTAASLLSPTWINPTCEDYDNPLNCELAAQNSLFAIFSIGTNDAFNPSQFKDNMREAIETAIAQNRLPVLMTKADDIEGGHRINQDIADLAAEYELPIVNFWAAVQDLPFKGLQQDGIHLTFYKNDFSDPRAYDAGWTFRNISTLYMLQLIKTETEALQREIEEEKRHEPQIKLANAVGETAGSGTDELAGDAENMQPDRNKGVVIIVGDDEDDGTVQPVADAQQQPSLIAIVREIGESLAESIQSEISLLSKLPRSEATAEAYYRYNPMTFIPEVQDQLIANTISFSQYLKSNQEFILICPLETK